MFKRKKFDQSRLRPQAAFTLIEIIIALTILGIGLVAVMSYLPVALDAAKKGADITKAAIIAQSVMEIVKDATYTDITGADSMDTALAYVDYNDEPGFQYQLSIVPQGVAQTKNVTIVIRWQCRGKFDTETFQSRIVKYNPA
ncbi:MAG: prepilin-type N-terminal cleavage/methylation domain-containing protein [Candidatus Omnitrophica bacterium]|nr:prepilin-type N-terminal cleavage/methylation domain-containing protein [Candidatus Omnitrophota bacterium]MBU1924446.1 prepilin-type N-terminal cleavage/methylation domain-containing protein [Candidatus Omnitrophota bacterium]